MIDISREFSSKILLFGEYSLMYGSMALSIPYNKFTGQLIIDKDYKFKDTHISQKYIIDYLDYLENHRLSELINVEQIKTDISRGLIFKCNIPISYGLGSSGAVVASFYDAYARKKTDDFEKLKNIFSEMESYYHGNSSGLDPLVSYLNKPVLVKENGNISTIECNHHNHINSGLFLVDTHEIGETQPLVQMFISEYQHPEYKNVIQNKIIPINRKCIDNYISDNQSSLSENFAALSQLTYDYFQPMIPLSIKERWENGLNSGLYSLKLCGSGGGGMMLGFSHNLLHTKEILGDIITI